MKNIYLVDADDTVLDFHRSSALAIRFAFEKCNVKWKDEYLQKYREVNNALWERLERKELTREELMDRRFPIFFDILGLTEVDGREFNRYYIEYLSNNPVYFEGAQDFLKTLRKTGRVFIVTNGTEYIQRSRFTIAKLWELSDEVFISQTTGYDKPDIRYTQYVIEHIRDFDKERAVWIGDSLSADIKAANDAQITSIWYNPNKKPLSGSFVPDFSVESFREILEILQKL